MLQVLVEISFYPLSDSYEVDILEFIKRLRSYDGIEVEPGQTSTVIRGDFDLVWAILETECKIALGRGSKSALVIKILNTA